MEKLVDDYDACAAKLTRMVYNGGVLDLKPRLVSTTTFQKDEDEQIKHIMKNKLMTSAGGLYRSSSETCF